MPLDSTRHANLPELRDNQMYLYKAFPFCTFPFKGRKAKHDGKIIVSFLCLDCSQTFATILKSQPLLTLNLKAQGSKGMNGSLPDKCKITGAQYLKQNLWKDLGRKEKDTFYIRRIPKWPYTNLAVCYVLCNV